MPWPLRMLSVWSWRSNSMDFLRPLQLARWHLREQAPQEALEGEYGCGKEGRKAEGVGDEGEIDVEVDGGVGVGIASCELWFEFELIREEVTVHRL
ncbi:hypothetical protein CRG98_010310 [Punica granatum]|uniref:Uncharacterized protein n=1 Tax=Punica granatum TaxID=22663 RepID=A0A2I0KLH9_PUNGR|nr:hypothetical protein CRG98_010310 [Punica granatum]